MLRYLFLLVSGLEASAGKRGIDVFKTLSYWDTVFKQQPNIAVVLHRDCHCLSSYTPTCDYAALALMCFILSSAFLRSVPFAGLKNTCCSSWLLVGKWKCMRTAKCMMALYEDQD